MTLSVFIEPEALSVVNMLIANEAGNLTLCDLFFDWSQDWQGGPYYRRWSGIVAGRQFLYAEPCLLDNNDYFSVQVHYTVAPDGKQFLKTFGMCCPSMCSIEDITISLGPRFAKSVLLHPSPHELLVTSVLRWSDIRWSLAIDCLKLGMILILVAMPGIVCTICDDSGFDSSLDQDIST